MTTDGTNTWNGRITVGQSFFEAYGATLYSNPTLSILARELLQNARDACTNGEPIRFTMRNYSDPDLSQPVKGFVQEITCDDKGIGMDRNVLENVFLTVGPEGSLKHNPNAVGGFGIAKVAIFSCYQAGWEVHTRDNYFDSSTMTGRTVKERKGTLVTARPWSKSSWRADEAWIKANLFLRSNTCRNLWLNGTKVQPYEGKRFLGAFYWRDQVRIEVSAAPRLFNEVNRIFWRINGLTQFITGVNEEINQNIIVDIQGVGYRPTEEGYPLGSSRENISDYSINFEVNKLIQPLTRNVVSARRDAEKLEKKGRKGGKVEHIRNTEAGYIVVDQPSGSTAADRKAYRQITALWGKLCELYNPNAQWGQVFGGMVAQNRNYNGKDTYLLNPKAFAEHWSHGDNPLAVCLVMWHLATHEWTHDQHSDHNEEFTCAQWGMSVETVLLITEHMGELRIIARKTLDSIAYLREQARASQFS